MVGIWTNITNLVILVFFFNGAVLSYGLATSCSESDFPCNDGGCIDAALWCDSSKDCSDGSDEAYCKKSSFLNQYPNRCPGNFFKCNDGPCIPRTGRCDGYKSCDDNSDERNCPSAYPKIVSISMIDKSEPVNYLFRQSNFIYQRNKTLSWLMSQMRDNDGWGDETPRALTALYLTNFSTFMKTKEPKISMMKQMEIQLSLAMVKNITKPMTDSELALYINALLASCKDPRNFYGINLVKILRHRVNVAQSNSKFVNPAVYLTLFISNVTTNSDIQNLEDLFSSQNNDIKRIDVQALAMLAISKTFENNYISAQKYDGFKTNFLQILKSRNSSGNIYEAALTVQVLIQLELPETKSEVSKLMDFILKQQQADGSFESILAAYLVLPILSGDNLLKIGKQCDPKTSIELTPIEVLKSPAHHKKRLKYILNIGDSIELSQILRIQVPEDIHFLDVMRLAQDINPQYRFSLNEDHEFPVVYSIGGIPNDAEKGMFWKLFVTSSFNSSDVLKTHLTPYTGNIKDLIPQEDDEIVFWYKHI